MDAPDKIYVREYPVGLNQEWDEKPRVRTVAIAQHEYIRKDALLEKIDEILSTKPDTNEIAVEIAAQAISDIRKVIDSM